MTDLLAARSLMAISLGFHILFAAIGIALPLLMVIAEALYARTGDRTWLVLARRWAKGTAVLFAVGAVSGTVLSFELGLLWPRFMDFAGPIIGMPFSMEGFAFFLEAIFLGIYLYGWDRLPRVPHLLAGVGVALCGMASGVFVVAVNGWMNVPTGFTLDAAGALASVSPWLAMANPAWIPQALHMTIAAYLAVCFGVAGVHAFMLLRDRANPFHRKALAISLVVGGACALIMPATGHLAAETVAHTQPVKLAAMEAHWETTTGAPFIIGGIPDEQAELTRYALEVPYLLSVLAYGDPTAEVMGLRDVAVQDRPPVAVVHYSFQLMIAIGMWLIALTLIAAGVAVLHRRVPDHPALLWALTLSAPLGMIGIEAGWIVTEVGRQPWVIYNLMRTESAVTPMPGLTTPLLMFTLLYVMLAVIVVALMRKFVLASPTTAEVEGFGGRVDPDPSEVAHGPA